MRLLVGFLPIICLCLIYPNSITLASLKVTQTVPYLLTFSTGEVLEEIPIVLDESRLPLSWTIQDRVLVTQADLSELRRRLRGEIVQLEEFIMDAGGFRLHRIFWALVIRQ